MSGSPTALGFAGGLDPDLRRALFAQLRNLWTHCSTAIEGNTLTLGETAFVIEEGLTVAGKPLKDHQEVVGHARAIELTYRLLGRRDAVTSAELFALHRAVQTEALFDILQPVGAWKVEPNGTNAVTAEGRQVFLEYAVPKDVPQLMACWLAHLNGHLRRRLSRDGALTAYCELHVAFVRVHPFFNGNGRLARLLANLPVLQAGFPPVVIPRERRRDYIGLLSRHALAAGTATEGRPLLPTQPSLEDLQAFCAEVWSASWDLVDQAHARQRDRRAQDQARQGDGRE